MEPVSILAGTLGAKFLEEGIKFLWAEAANILARYHKSREAKEPEPPPAAQKAPAALQFPDERRLDLSAVAPNREKLERLSQALMFYGIGSRPVSLDDEELLENADELHALIASLYGLEKVNLIVRSHVRVGKVGKDGEMTGVRARNVREGRIESTFEADEVHGTGIGVDLDND